MNRAVLVIAFLVALLVPALPQFQGNPIVPTPPTSPCDVSNRIANTEFVNLCGLGGAGGNPLTKTDDTNVTLTLGGAPNTALLTSTSLTLGWTGTLAAGRLNSNVVQAVVSDTNITGSILAQTLTLGWAGTLAVGRGGTACSIASGTCLDNITGFTSTGFVQRTSPGTYAFVPDPLPIANGGTGKTTAVAARQSAGLNIFGDSATGYGDVATAIANTDRCAYTTTSLSTSRAWTLPAANVTGAPYAVCVVDMAGAVNGANTLTVQRAGADTVNGGTSVNIGSANGGYLFLSDGSSKWSAQAFGASAGVTSIGGLSGVVGLTATDLATSGSDLQLSAGRRTNPTTQLFTTHGTWTKPANTLWIEVHVVGGGGSGGGAPGTAGAQCSASGGGGGGGYGYRVIATPNTTEAVTIGGGGAAPAAGAAGNAGGTTTFGTVALVAASGGNPGGQGGPGDPIIATGGAGGLGSTGTLLMGGGPGSKGSCTAAGLSPGGGDGGMASKGGGGGRGSGGGSGGNGSAYGGGGGGSYIGPSTAAQSAGAGAAGMVLVIEHYN